MDSITFAPNQRLELRLDSVPYAQPVRVLDQLPEALLVRVPDTLDQTDPPEAVEIAFGNRGAYCHASVGVRAFYSLAWFLDLPDPATLRRVQRRQFVRISHQDSAIALESTPYGEPTSAPFELTIDNISAGGCRGIVQRESVSDFVTIFLSVLGMPSEPTFARVMSRRSAGDGKLVLGIAFDSANSTFQDELAHLINREIQRNLQLGIDITV